MTRLESSSLFASRIASVLTLYFLASDLRVSVDLTFTTRPLTGGIVSFWPGRSLIDVSLLAQKMVALSTLYFLLRLASVSPDLTLCLRSRSLPSGTVVSTDTGLSSVPSSRNGPLIASSRAAGAYVTGLTSRNSGVTGTSACSGPVDFCSTPKAPPTDEARRRSVPGGAAHRTTDRTARHAVNGADGRCVRCRGLGSDADHRRDADHADDEDGGDPVMADPVEQAVAVAGQRSNDRDLRRRPVPGSERREEVRSSGSRTELSVKALGDRHPGRLSQRGAASLGSGQASNDGLRAERGVEQYVLLATDGQRWGSQLGQEPSEGRAIELGVSFAAEPTHIRAYDIVANPTTGFAIRANPREAGVRPPATWSAWTGTGRCSRSSPGG